MIIGISGKLGTGKTTVVNHIIQILAENSIISTKISFADILKEEASRIYGFPIEAAYNNKEMPITLDKDCPSRQYRNPDWTGRNPTVREILQFYGTNVIREKDPNHWVKELDLQCRKLIKDYGDDLIIFIDDVRFPNEKEYAEQHGICYRIEAYPGYPHRESHASECVLDNSKFARTFSPAYGELLPVAEMIAQEVIGLVQNQDKSPTP